jgi:hypothetical protein
MKFVRMVFWIAALYGVAVIFPLYFAEQSLTLQNPPAITHPEYYYSFIGVTLVWQMLFIFIALKPQRLRIVMIPCAAEKLSLLPTFLILNSQGRFPQLWLPLLIIDLVFALLFVVAFFKAGKKTQEPDVATQAVRPGGR